MVELKHSGKAEVIAYLHFCQGALVKTHLDLIEAAFFVFGCGGEPGQAFMAAGICQYIEFLDLIVASQQCRRAAAQCLAQLLDGDLLNVDVVKVDFAL